VMQLGATKFIVARPVRIYQNVACACFLVASAASATASNATPRLASPQVLFQLFRCLFVGFGI